MTDTPPPELPPRGPSPAGVVARGALALAGLALAACPAGPATVTTRPPKPIVPPPVVAQAPVDLTPPAHLDDGMRPVAYRLTVDVDPGEPGFTGEVEIDLDLDHATRALWFHAHPDVTARPRVLAPAEVVIEQTREPADDSLLGLALSEPVGPGRITVAFGFTTLYGSREGVFVQETRGRNYVFTDFEPTDARRAFPCLDEPRWKAPWTITVRAPDDLRTYANSPVAAVTRQGDGWSATRFETTPPLPTYLVAFAVGRFDEVVVEGAPVPARILVPEGRASAAADAAALLGPIATAAAAVIDRPIPFAKLDVVAVPSFAGAMENPGLITVASDILFETGDGHGITLLATVLAHEVGHLWFGDQVTLHDWREVWLNEGAASWMAHETLARAFPTWAAELERVDDRSAVMLDDSLPASHPLRPAAVGAPRALFDVISYKKGAAVWHGLAAWLGPDRFRDALGVYLDRHAWGSVTTADLIAAVAEVAPDAPVDAVVRAAVERAGVPAVTVEVTCQPGAATAHLRVDAGHGPTPVCARWGHDRSPRRACTVVDGAGTLDLGPTCPAWFHPNAGAEGYYTWRMARTWWGNLARAPLTPTELKDTIDDLDRALARGDAGLAEARPLLAAAVASGRGHLVVPALDLYRLLMRIVDRDSARALAGDLDRSAHKVLTAIGWSARRDEPPDRARVRAALLRAAGELVGDRRVVRWARRQLQQWLRKGRLTDADALPVLVVSARWATRRQAAALVAAASKRTPRSLTVNEALGRALAVLPGDGAQARAALRARLPASVELGLLSELLADPARAGEVHAQLGERSVPVSLAIGPIFRCDVPPPRSPRPRVTALEWRAAAIAARAARCRAVVTRLRPAPELAPGAAPRNR